MSINRKARIAVLCDSSISFTMAREMLSGEFEIIDKLREKGAGHSFKPPDLSVGHLGCSGFRNKSDRKRDRANRWR